MDERAFGIESEYIVVYLPVASDAESPSKRQVYGWFEEELLARMPALRNDPSEQNLKEALFLANGASFLQELRLGYEGEGPIEMASPECRDPVSLLAAEAAKDAWMEELAAAVNARLPALGYAGRVVVAKGSVDSEGNTCASHENYGVHDPLPALPRLLMTAVGRHAFQMPWEAVALLGRELTWLVAALLAVIALATGSGRNMLFVGMLVVAWCSWAAVRVKLPWSPDPIRRYYRYVGRVLRRIYFRPVQRALPAHLATRIAFSGAGRVSFDGGPLFRVSARSAHASAVVCEESGTLVFFDLRDVFLSRERAAQPLRRLHVMLGDANLCEWAMLLRVGSTALVLEAIEAAPDADWPQLEDPVRALRRLDADASLRCALRLEGGGTATALAIQRAYLEQVSRTLGAAPLAAWKRRVLEMWRETLDLLESDPRALVGRVDWITKRALLDDLATPRDWQLLAEQGARLIEADEPGLDPEQRRLRRLAFRLWSADLRYHELSPSGGFRRVQARGSVWRATGLDDVERARTAPPADTRAHARGELIRRLHGVRPQPAAAELGASWERVRFAGDEWRLSPDPLDTRPAQLAAVPNAATVGRPLQPRDYLNPLLWTLAPLLAIPLIAWIALARIPVLEGFLAILSPGPSSLGGLLLAMAAVNRLRRPLGLMVVAVVLMLDFLARALGPGSDEQRHLVNLAPWLLIANSLHVDPLSAPRPAWLPSAALALGGALPLALLLGDASSAIWTLPALASALAFGLAYREHRRGRGEQAFDPWTCALVALSVACFAWPTLLGPSLTPAVVAIAAVTAERWLTLAAPAPAASGAPPPASLAAEASPVG